MRFVAALMAAFVLWTPEGFGQSPLPPVPPEWTTWFVTGDMVYPGHEKNLEKTGRQMTELLNLNSGSRGMLVGDLCNFLEPSDECYERLYASPWGPLMPQLRAVPGNHDYGSTYQVLPPFYRYVFNTDREGLGYYDFPAGNGWLGIGLNTELSNWTDDPIIQRRRKSQLDWFEKTLHENYNSKCIIVFMHRPPFSSGEHAGKKWTDDLFRKAFKYGVDLIVAAHEHFRAYIPPLAPNGSGKNGVVNWTQGIPILIYGTGGAILFPRPKNLLYGDVITADKLGIGRIDLKPKFWRTEFLPESPDPGVTYPPISGTCHDNPSGFVE